jgi:hypothetical protein
MTDYTDLIARLRGNDMPWSVKDAADALEAQARRIAELEYDATYHESNDEVMMRDIEYYRARIAELEAALLPFAVIADESTANLADNYMYSDCYPMSAFRAAKAALEKKND